MKVAIISDTHNYHHKIDLPTDVDTIVHCGDLTMKGNKYEIVSFLDWFDELPHKNKVFIAGNHDFEFEKPSDWLHEQLDHRNFYYLQDDFIIIDGIKFYGSPWQPEFFDWAFNLPRGPELAAMWNQIPQDTDFLITHGPPEGILDKTLEGDAVGCYDLLQRVKVVKPKIHAFGHIHEGYGTYTIADTLFVNASTCTRSYDPFNAPIIVNINKWEGIEL